MDGLVRTATDRNYREFFEKYNVKVRFYGDYRDVLKGTLIRVRAGFLYEVTEATKDNTGFNLFFGVFADEATETIARLSVEHYLAHSAVPNKTTLIRKYYGEDLPPVSLFIGFDKFSTFDMPLLGTGEEDLYFSVSPSPYMTERQLRAILYDHIYVRRTPEPEYTKMNADELDWLRKILPRQPGPSPRRRQTKIQSLAPRNRRRIMTDLIAQFLEEIGPGHMASTAYDTAWVARLGDIDWNLSSRALSWLAENQLPDGSWGAPAPMYYHDRVICTLAAMIALTYRGRRVHDKVLIENGKQALEWIVGNATQGLHSDPNGATAGFEMIVPTLVAEAEKLGILKWQGDRVLGRLSKQRAEKISYLHGNMISRHVTMAFSAEMAGTDGQHMLDIENLQESNGSVGVSPAASAYFASYVKKGDPASLTYLNSTIKPDGGFPNAAPFDIFEIAWSLWNLGLIPEIKVTAKTKTTYRVSFESLGAETWRGFCCRLLCKRQ
ncbi:MAG: hypothetical protein MZV64_19365 [Ignavibacteriales bacterium]|nr:hypothetical protein [Ignavibacteriales bacterium]